LIVPAVLLGFGVPGLREVLLVALVALSLYGRSGAGLLRSTRYGRLLQPWLGLVQAGPRVAAAVRPSRTAARTAGMAPPPPTGRRVWRRGRGFWLLVVVGTVAAAAWVATRAEILNTRRASHPAVRTEISRPPTETDR